MLFMFTIVAVFLSCSNQSNSEYKEMRITTIVDGFDVKRVNLYSSTSSDRKVVAYCLNYEEVSVLDSVPTGLTSVGEEYYIKVKKSTGDEGWCLSGFLEIL